MRDMTTARCWHLSRYRTLFFSCSLFITLAFCVHLIPHFPSISASLSPAAAAISSDSCILSLQSVNYSGVVERLPNKSWDWAVSNCGFRKLNKSQVSDLLNGSWIVVAGDSESRLTALSLLISLMGFEIPERVLEDLFKRHDDYPFRLKDIDMKLDFLWSPYTDNFTQYISQLRQNKTCPDFILFGAEIWEMLYVHNATQYGASLKALRENLLALMSEIRNSRSLPHLFWIGMPEMVTALLGTADWRTKLGDEMRHLYDNELMGSKLLSDNGGPFFKLDLHRLSDSCGRNCTGDGIHYDELVYDSAVQIMFNALRIESDRKPR